jgi:hypothetical protein
VNLAELQRRLLRDVVVTARTGELSLVVPFALLKQIVIQSDLLRAQFKEDWYLATYPDVALQVRMGSFESGLDHFLQQGLWNGRLGRPMQVDEAWYAGFYSDVGLALANEDFADATKHFEEHGFVEGRAAAAAFLVEPSWYRERYPDAHLEVRLGKYLTLQHYFNYEGFARGHQANSGCEDRG